jgi:hypothetical protein
LCELPIEWTCEDCGVNEESLRDCSSAVVVICWFSPVSLRV